MAVPKEPLEEFLVTDWGYPSNRASRNVGAVCSRTFDAWSSLPPHTVGSRLRNLPVRCLLATCTIAMVALRSLSRFPRFPS